MDPVKQVGVEAIVTSLSKFLGDMGKVNSSLDGVRSHGTLLQRAFGSISDALVGFGQHVLRVAEYALGKILADAIQWVARVMGELVQETIDAGAEFQILELRLERLNFNDLVNSGMEYNEAMEESIRLTKEQLEWIQALAGTTPYDATDVANVYTLARSYGNSAEEAKNLTETILDFASGMGLGNTEIERIIINFGQMQQQGKVTGMEMRDLARGAFVPVNDVLDIMKEKTGLTGKAFDDFRNSGEGVEMFIASFAELVDERFAGAAEKMAQTFKGATDNVKDLVKSFFGLDLVKPILDTLGEKISIFNNQFATMTEEGPKFTELGKTVKRSLEKIRDTIVEVIDTLMGNVAPEDFAKRMVTSLQKVADWFADNKDAIVDWVKDSVKWIKETLIPTLKAAWKFLFGSTDEETGEKREGALEKVFKWFMENRSDIFSTIERIGTFIYDYIVKTVEKISDWVEANGTLIDDFFGARGEIIADVIEGLTGSAPTTGGGFIENILALVKDVMQWIIDHKDAIAGFIEGWIRFSIYLEIIKTALLAVASAILSVVSFLGLAAGIIALLTTPLGLLIVLITALVVFWLTHYKQLSTTWKQLGFIIKYYWNKLWEDIDRITRQIGAIVSYYWNKLWEDIDRITRQIGAIVSYYWNKLWEDIDRITDRKSTRLNSSH